MSSGRGMDYLRPFLPGLEAVLEKDMLARPLPYNIRIDTFEIWRSERIYPDGVNLYQAPA